MNFKRFLWCVLCMTLVILLLLGGCGKAKEAAGTYIYVSTEGSDETGKGTAKKPFATVGRAQTEAKALRASENPPEGTVTVVIKDGTYDITDGLVFTEEDSNAVYKADGKVTLTGGVMLDEASAVEIPADIVARFKAEALPHIRAYDLTKLGLTSEDWGKIYAYGNFSTAYKYDGDTLGPAYADLYVGGEHMTLARYPNGEKLTLMLRIFSPGEYCKSSEQWEALRNPQAATLKLTNELFSRIEAWATIDDVWMGGYFCYDWADMTTPLASIDTENQTVTPAYTSYYGYDGPKFYFFNVLEELDVPGEWYLDRTSGIVYFYPPEGSEDAAVTISITTSDLITINGAENLIFEGLEITGTRGSGIVATGNYITVKNCVIAQMSKNAVSLTGYNNTVSGCEIHDVGEDAIALYGGDRATLTPSNSIAENNLIYRWSEITRTYKAAVRLEGVGLSAAHNEMFDAPHLAVFYKGNDILIEYNEIYGVCYNTGDGGAIYAGRSWSMYGCMIRYNYIHGIYSPRAYNGGPVGVYLDDALSGQTVYGNLFQNLEGRAVVVGGGRDNVITNNLLVNVEYKEGISYDERARNVYLANGWSGDNLQQLLGTLAAVPYNTGNWAGKYPALAKVTTDSTDPDAPEFIVNPAGGVIQYNVVCCSASSSFDIHDSVYIYSTVSDNLFLASDADPGFADYEGGDLNLKEDSVIFAELPGFEALPFDQMGRIE